jgi:hypothetical protein
LPKTQGRGTRCVGGAEIKTLGQPPISLVDPACNGDFGVDKAYRQ